MTFSFEYEIGQMYERWLLEEYPEDVPNKEELIKKVENDFMYDEFMELVKKNL